MLDYQCNLLAVLDSTFGPEPMKRRKFTAVGAHPRYRNADVVERICYL